MQLSARQVFHLLTPERVLEAVDEALRWERAGASEVPLRTRLESRETMLLSMPAAAPHHFGVKVLTMSSPRRNLGSQRIQGILLLFDKADGTLSGVFDGAAVTAARTAGIASWATRQLSPPGATRFLLVGAGVQARRQIAAVLAVRAIREVRIWSRTEVRARELVRALSRQHPQVEIVVARDLTAAAKWAQIITLATSSPEPLLHLRELPEECHINALGAHDPKTRELATDIITAADVYADTLTGCLMEAGDLLIPIHEGVLDPEKVHALATADGRTSRLTVMKSVGSAVFDVACGAMALRLRSAAGQLRSSR
jgi:alanine dehydrogenase